MLVDDADIGELDHYKYVQLKFEVEIHENYFRYYVHALMIADLNEILYFYYEQPIQKIYSMILYKKNSFYTWKSSSTSSPVTVLFILDGGDASTTVSSIGQSAQFRLCCRVVPVVSSLLLIRS